MRSFLRDAQLGRRRRKRWKEEIGEKPSGIGFFLLLLLLLPTRSSFTPYKLGTAPSTLLPNMYSSSYLLLRLPLRLLLLWNVSCSSRSSRAESTGENKADTTVEPFVSSILLLPSL